MVDDVRVPDSVTLSGDTNAKGNESQQIRLELDESQVQASYANLCFVSSTAEEIILDLALNKNPVNETNRRIRLSQRVVLSPYTAKRLASLLTAAVQRHERVFGPLETDAAKRAQGNQASRS